MKGKEEEEDEDDKKKKIYLAGLFFLLVAALLFRGNHFQVNLFSDYHEVLTQGSARVGILLYLAWMFFFHRAQLKESQFWFGLFLAVQIEKRVY